VSQAPPSLTVALDLPAGATLLANMLLALIEGDPTLMPCAASALVETDPLLLI
jgi:hypothetical protein